jgi:hypothetical protein
LLQLKKGLGAIPAALRRSVVGSQAHGALETDESLWLAFGQRFADGMSRPTEMSRDGRVDRLDE